MAEGLIEQIISEGYEISIKKGGSNCLYLITLTGDSIYYGQGDTLADALADAWTTIGAPTL